jgi:hypothetical protein
MRVDLNKKKYNYSTQFMEHMTYGERLEMITEFYYENLKEKEVMKNSRFRYGYFTEYGLILKGAILCAVINSRKCT